MPDNETITDKCPICDEQIANDTDTLTAERVLGAWRVFHKRRGAIQCAMGFGECLPTIRSRAYEPED